MAILTNQKPTVYRNMYENTGPGGGRPQIEVCTSFEVYTSIKLYCTSIEVRLQPQKRTQIKKLEKEGQLVQYLVPIPPE